MVKKRKILKNLYEKFNIAAKKICILSEFSLNHTNKSFIQRIGNYNATLIELP